MTADRDPRRGAQIPVDGRATPKANDSRGPGDNTRGDNDPHNLDSLDPDPVPMTPHANEHHGPPPYCARMASHHPLNSCARPRLDLHALAVPTNGDPVSGNPHAHARAMTAQPDELVERDPNLRWLTDLQGPCRRRGAAVHAGGIGGVVLGVAADRVRADTADRHLSASAGVALSSDRRPRCRRCSRCPTGCRQPWPSRTASPPSRRHRPGPRARSSGCCYRRRPSWSGSPARPLHRMRSA